METDTKNKNGLFIESNKKNCVPRMVKKAQKSQYSVSVSIDKVKHVSPLLIRKTGKWATGQK